MLITKTLTTNTFKVFLIMAAFSIFVAQSQLWQGVFVEKTHLENPHVRKETLTAGNAMMCAQMARNNRWPRMFCFKNETCSLYDILRVPLNHKNGMKNPVHCLTMFMKDGKRYFFV